MTIVIKKDGTPRICIDFRKLNLKTKKDAKGVPRINDILDALNGARVLSSLDLQSGYWEVAIKEECKQYTTFTAGPLGCWEFKRMSFGQVNSGATFQRLMEATLGELLFKECLVYVDDIIVYSSSIDDQLERMQNVFNKLTENNLELNPEKCRIFQT